MNDRVKFTVNRSALFLVSACIIIGCLVLLSATAFSQSGAEGSSPRVTGITPGRAKAIGGAVVGLISLIVGWRAKRNKGNSRSLAITALILGGIAIILSVLHLFTSAGAVFGSGSGKAGAIVALILAVVGSILGGMALAGNKGIPERQVL